MYCTTYSCSDLSASFFFVCLPVPPSCTWYQVVTVYPVPLINTLLPSETASTHTFSDVPLYCSTRQFVVVVVPVRSAVSVDFFFAVVVAKKDYC